MKKYINISTFLLLIVHSYTIAQKGIFPKTPILKNYSVSYSILGDLDNDLIKELVVAYTSKEKTEDGNARELIIYKLKNKQWTEWKKSKTALSNYYICTRWGDPLNNIEIKKNRLLITHISGRPWTTECTDEYRFQNSEFYLIGYNRSYHDGNLGTSYDCNLSTGKMIVTKYYEENKEPKIETFYKKGLKVTLQNRNTKEITIVSPKYNFEIYLARIYE